MAAAGRWPLVLLMDRTEKKKKKEKKSPDWFTVDRKPCQLKPETKRVTAAAGAPQAAAAPVIYRPICLAAARTSSP